jgi:hypothetical protein
MSAFGICSNNNRSDKFTGQAMNDAVTRANIGNYRKLLANKSNTANTQPPVG